MRDQPRLFRLASSVALSALLWDVGLPPQAAAQPAPPPLPAPYQTQPGQNQADPPSRVGRLAQITGEVSFRSPTDTQWASASLNFPVSTGDVFWTQPDAQAQLQISDSRIDLAPTTEFDVAALDASGLQAVAAQGEAYLHLRDLSPQEAWLVQTPRGLVRLGGQGRYDVVVGTTDTPTLITVIDGSATVEGPNLSLQVAGGQTAMINGTDNFHGSVGPALRSAFLSARLDAERPPPALAAHIPAEVVSMPGGGDLSTYGSWAEAPDYGQVWYPQVASGWVPYREGHWAYVAPWGWTWIDNAPWGFAPFHYGRWVELGGRWAWTPGAAAVAGPPVYAPALVTFIGIGTGVALSATAAFGTVGWVPLGPREPFHPWYHASPTYIRQVNVSHVTNINNNVTINNYINRSAATAVPAGAMTGSQPVQAMARPIRPQELTAAQPIIGQQPLRPGAATVGVTPAVARQFNLPPTVLRPAPGPTVRPLAAGPAGFARPGFAPAGASNPALRPIGAGQPPVRLPPPATGVQEFHPGQPNPAAERPAPANRPELRGPEPRGTEPRVTEPATERPRIDPNRVRPNEPPPPRQPEVHQPEVSRPEPRQAEQRPPEPRPAQAAAPLPQVQHPAPLAAEPRPQPQRLAAPPPALRPEPQRAAPAARAEPSRAAPAERRPQ